MYNLNRNELNTEFISVHSACSWNCNPILSDYASSGVGTWQISLPLWKETHFSNFIISVQIRQSLFDRTAMSHPIYPSTPHLSPQTIEPRSLSNRLWQISTANLTMHCPEPRQQTDESPCVNVTSCWCCTPALTVCFLAIELSGKNTEEVGYSDTLGNG